MQPMNERVTATVALGAWLVLTTLAAAPRQKLAGTRLVMSNYPEGARVVKNRRDKLNSFCLLRPPTAMKEVEAVPSALAGRAPPRNRFPFLSRSFHHVFSMVPGP